MPCQAAQAPSARAIVSDGTGFECISQSHLVTHERRHGCACASPAAGARCQALPKAKEAAAKRSAVACAGEAVEGAGGKLRLGGPSRLQRTSFALERRCAAVEGT